MMEPGGFGHPVKAAGEKGGDLGHGGLLGCRSWAIIVARLPHQDAEARLTSR
jgi:hypothetical protein